MTWWALIRKSVLWHEDHMVGTIRVFTRPITWCHMVLSHGIDMVGINKTYDIVASMFGLVGLERLEDIPL